MNVIELEQTQLTTRQSTRNSQLDRYIFLGEVDSSAFTLGWQGLQRRSQVVLALRFLGMTLDGIADHLQLTRERVRQLVKEAKEMVVNLTPEPALQDLTELTESQHFVTLGDTATALGVIPGPWLDVLLQSQRFFEQEIYGDTPIDDRVYGREKFSVKKALAKLSMECPVSVSSMQTLVTKHPAVSLLDRFSFDGPVVYEPDYGILRRSALTRDRAWILLSDAGEPIKTLVLCEALSTNIKALRAQLARDPRFAENSVEKVWALKDWRLFSGERLEAKDALKIALQKFGPAKTSDLIQRAQTILPRSYSRYVQALEGELFGLNQDGLWNLVSLGAEQVMPIEPRKTASIDETHFPRVAATVSITSDMIRGSGFPVDRRLTWVAGLRQPTKSLTFKFKAHDEKAIALMRTPGNSSLGSIKWFIDEIGLKVKCLVQILFDFEGQIVHIRAICTCHKI